MQVYHEDDERVLPRKNPSQTTSLSTSSKELCVCLLSIGNEKALGFAYLRCQAFSSFIYRFLTATVTADMDADSCLRRRLCLALYGEWTWAFPPFIYIYIPEDIIGDFLCQLFNLRPILPARQLTVELWWIPLQKDLVLLDLVHTKVAGWWHWPMC